MTNIAISYARFSSVGQADGDSLRRQTEDAEAYAQANNLVIDRSLSFRDLGVSAYDQSNIRKGALGLFLKAIEEGRVPIGATLIIESFDRLSRAKPFDALGPFSDIINAGLNLVTLTKPPRVFNRESIDNNTFQLFEALIDMDRAHKESKRKSDLVGSAWADKKRRAVDGAVMSLKAPHWITVETNPNLGPREKLKRVAKLNPERAKIALRIVEMAENGIGNHTIIRTLHATGVQPWSKPIKRKNALSDWSERLPQWEPSYIQKLLSNVALYGAIDLDGEIIENYYPPLISQDRFIALEAMRAARATTTNYNRKGKTVTNLFTGLLKCGYCGSSVNIAGYKSLVTGYERKYVACHGARTAATKCKMKMWFLDELEPSLLFWLTNLDYSRIVGSRKHGALSVEKETLAVLETKLTKATGRVEATMDAIADGAKSMVPRLHDYEAEVASLRKTTEAQRKKVIALTNQGGEGASRMRSLVLLFKAMKQTGDELKLRTLREQLLIGINETIEKIVLYPAGRKLSGSKADRFIDVTFRTGTERRIEGVECAPQDLEYVADI